MKHFKLLFASLALFGAVNANAQTDVTADLLTNADFSASTPLEVDLRGYGKDMVGDDVYGIQEVDGWQYTILSGDNNTAAYPNSGMGGAVFAYGSSNYLRGNNVNVPAVGPDGNSGNGLAFFAVWGCGAYYYQDVTLQPGEYTISIPVYCISGTQNNTSYIGFIPNSGSKQVVATNPAVGQWTTQTVSFTLAAETAGKIVLGYQSTGSGSGANPHLVIDKVTIMYTSTVVKDELASVIEIATSTNDKVNDSNLAAAIAAAQAVYDNPTASQDEVNAQVEALQQAISAATTAYIQEKGDATVLINNPGFELTTPETTNWASGANPNSANYATTGWTNSQGAGWSSSAVVEYRGAGQVNGASAPETDNEGNPGNALGISVGWSGKVTYKSNTILLPAGAYTLTLNAYNNNSATQFKSQNGFISTNGSSYLSTKTSFPYGEWTTDVITFILNEDTEGYIQIGGQAYDTGSGNNAKVFFDNITLTYSDPLEALKNAYQEARAAAQEAWEDPVYSNIFGEENDALYEEFNKEEPTTKEGYEEAIAALQQATATFIAAKDAYDAWANISSEGTPELIYADPAKKTAVEEALDPMPVTAADAQEKTAAIYQALRAYYESHALAEGVDGAVDYTSAIESANANTNSGWNHGIGTNQGQGYTEANGNVAPKYLDGGWASNAGVNIDMTREVAVPAGKYLLTVTARGAVDLDQYTLSIADQTIDLPHIGGSGGVFNNGWNDASIEFESNGNPLTLEIIAKSTAYQQWISFDRFRLVQLEEIEVPMADEADYAALYEAIAPYQTLELGFDEDEYAPYNNVDAILLGIEIDNLDEEKIQNKEYTKEFIQGLTARVYDLLVEPNETEVNAIYDGEFANTEANTTSGDINLPGWTKVQGIRLLVKDEATDPGIAFTDGKAALFSWGGTTLTYGEQDGYTLPLNEGELYELTFKISGWRDGGFANVLTVALDGQAQTINPNIPGRINDAEGNPFTDVKFYFTPSADVDNSILTIYANQHFAIADLKLMKVQLTDLVLLNADTEVPEEQYAGTVTTDRVLLEGLNTLVLPFETTKEEIGATTVLEYTGTTVEEDGLTLNFTEVESLSANVPYAVMMDADAAAPLSFEMKEVTPAEDLTVADDNFTFVGTYVDIPKGNDVVVAGDYVAGAEKFKKAKGGNRVAAYRAYLKKAEEVPAEVKIAFNFDGTIVDGIEAVEILNKLSGNIYNLNGQKMEKAQKGVNIINGKKVLVK